MSIFEEFHQALTEVVHNYQARKARKSISVLRTDNVEGLINLLEAHRRKSPIHRNACELRLDVINFATQLPIDWWTEMLLLFTEDITLRKELLNVLQKPEYSQERLTAQGFNEANQRYQRILDNIDTQKVAHLLEENDQLKQELAQKTAQIQTIEGDLQAQKDACTYAITQRDKTRHRNLHLEVENCTLKEQLADLQKKLEAEQAKNTSRTFSTEEEEYVPSGIFKIT